METDPGFQRRLDWAVMQAKSELARQQTESGIVGYGDMPDVMYAPVRFDLRALVAVVLEAGDTLRSPAGMLSPDDVEFVNDG